jgi:hypothetical protein
VLEFKTVWRDDTTDIVMSPFEFMPRLAAGLLQVPLASIAGACTDSELRGGDFVSAKVSDGCAP